jgi:lipid-A-disaccharide synthase
MDKEVVKELIQGEFNTNNLAFELTNILDFSRREKMFNAYYDLEQKLGGAGASKNTANLIVAN